MTGGRPGVLPWLYYAFGGTIPKHAQWVLHDLTCRTWLLRHALHSFIQCSPGFLLLLLPGSFPFLFYLPAIVVIGGVWVAMMFARDARNHRLYKHGFIPDLVLARNKR
ncbi:DUF5313 family protein [Sciscionella sediminilitoris]|uniref:DUF5313 family protein n=1 Tax=Sciscionella sediminilitoris TaxID=1445613 RepID=UPI00068D5E1C|nr:DUF5313 family protein [Sciscionella sp. SE31]